MLAHVADFLVGHLTAGFESELSFMVRQLSSSSTSLQLFRNGQRWSLRFNDMLRACHF